MEGGGGEESCLFICCLAAWLLTLSHWRGDSFICLMLITAFCFSNVIFSGESTKTASLTSFKHFENLRLKILRCLRIFLKIVCVINMEVSFPIFLCLTWRYWHSHSIKEVNWNFLRFGIGKVSEEGGKISVAIYLVEQLHVTQILPIEWSGDKVVCNSDLGVP